MVCLQQPEKEVKPLMLQKRNSFINAVFVSANFINGNLLNTFFVFIAACLTV